MYIHKYINCDCCEPIYLLRKKNAMICILGSSCSLIEIVANSGFCYCFESELETRILLTYYR